MELKITGTEVVQEPIQFNYEELKKQITDKAELYKNMVYDEEHVKEAKADRATLNKFKSALEGKRRDVKKECLKPYEEFEKQVNDLIGIIDEPIALIDSQVKGYEEEEKQKKAIAIQEMFNDMNFPGFVKFNMISDSKWLNKSISMKKVSEELDSCKARVESAVQTLEALPEFGFEAMEEYKRSLDLSRAIAEGQRLANIQKRKAEAEAEKRRLEAEAKAREEARIQAEAEAKEAEATVKPADEPIETHTTVEASFIDDAEPKQWLEFKAHVTVKQARVLGDFCRENGIELKLVK